MGMVGGACLPSNAYYPRTPNYSRYSGVHVCWSEHSDSSFVYGFMSLDYGLGTMTTTTFNTLTLVYLSSNMWTLCPMQSAYYSVLDCPHQSMLRIYSVWAASSPSPYTIVGYRRIIDEQRKPWSGSTRMLRLVRVLNLRTVLYNHFLCRKECKDMPK